MPIQLQDVITAARDMHPSLHPSRVTNAVLARALTIYQRHLVGRAMLKDRTYLAQQASIIFAQQGTVGAALGGYPVAVSNSGVISRERPPVGYAEELATANATILVAEFVPASTTTTSITKTAAGWTTNQYVNAYVEVVAGTGLDQRRVITSNTSTVLSFAAFAALDATSVVRIVSLAPSVSEEVGVVTQLPAEDQRIGYLVKLDAAGVPYVDLTTPLVATFDRGIPLPMMKHLIGGVVRFTDQQWPCELTIVPYMQRADKLGDYTASVMNRQLFIQGSQSDWNTAESIELRYVPEPPALTALTDYFLLPDHASPCLVAHAAYIAGNRVNGLEGLPPVDLALLGEERSRAESAFLSEVGAQMRAATSRIKEAW